MRRFILKILIFLAIILVVCSVVKIFFPYHWANTYYSVKIRHLEKEKIYPQAVFFGSSRVYRQVNVGVFDSTYHALSGESIRSFNLGAPATFCPQSYFLLENFLRSDASKKLRYAFVELTDLDVIGSEVLHEARTNYWHNSKEFSFVMRSVFGNSSLSFSKKMEYFRHYTVSYLENAYNIGHFGEMLVNENYYDPTFLGKSNNGYMSLEEEFETSSSKTVRKNLLERMKSLTIKGLNQRAREADKFLEQPRQPFDPVHMQRIEELKAMAEQKGVKLVFLLCPRAVNAYSGALYHKIPPSDKIELASPHLYPELYEKRYSFDIGHLNTSGSRIFSVQLARAFHRLKNSQ